MMDYKTIFDQRGADYHLAMRLSPQARRAEFERLFDVQPLAGGESLFDIPSGGGYLADYLSVPACVTGFEFSRGFADENPDVRLLRMDEEWPIGQADRVISLAGLHHNADPVAVIGRLKSHVRPGGWLHVADVAAGSRIGEFLNGFVDSANPMGHEGVFLPTSRDAYPSHWDVRRLKVCGCPWIFDSMDEMKRFCRLMFGLRQDCDDGLEQALREIVGVERTARGVSLGWELLYLDVYCE